jgi:hypothetical protein
VTVERWIASVDVGVGPNGVRLRKKITGPTRKAVAAKLREIRREQDSGRGVAPPGGVVRRQGWQAAGAGGLPGLQQMSGEMLEWAIARWCITWNRG